MLQLLKEHKLFLKCQIRHFQKHLFTGNPVMIITNISSLFITVGSLKTSAV